MKKLNACIVYISSRDRCISKSLESLWNNYNNKYDYPVYVHYFDDIYDSKEFQDSILNSCPQNVIFKSVPYKTPEFLEEKEHPLAVGARRRRAVWSGREEVQQSYGSRKPLEALEPAVLKAYVKWGFIDRDDGQVELACNPETEATIFGSRGRYGPLSTFERLRDIKAETHILAGTQTDLGKVWFEQQAKEIDTEVNWIEGGHFFFFEDIERSLSLIREYIG